MRRIFVPFLVGIFLSFSVGVWGNQNSTAPIPADSQQQSIQINAAAGGGDCGGLFDSLRTARQDLMRDEDTLSIVSDIDDAMAANDENFSPESLRQDLLFFARRAAEFNQCASSTDTVDAAPDPSTGCAIEPLLNFQVSHHGEPAGEIPIWQLPGSPAFFYEAGMTIDADGAPNAYHPDNTGLDDLRNAGAPGYWEGLGQGQRRGTLRARPERSISRLLRFGNRACRPIQACKRSHALRRCVEDPFRGAAGLHGARSWRASGRLCRRAERK